MNTRVRLLCTTALFTALLTVGAWITVPVGIPPYTMQSFVLYCALWLLPFRQSFAAVTLYLLMGAIGLPVLAGFQGGFGVLLGPTGGYLLGFLLMPFVMRAANSSPASRILFCALGTLGCYLSGTAWYVLAYGEISLAGVAAATVQCVLPFILPDAVKLVLAAAVCKRLEPRLHKM